MKENDAAEGSNPNDNPPGGALAGLVRWWREQAETRKLVGDEWRWWHWIPYSWLFTRDWWAYVLGPMPGREDTPWWRVAICRWRGHAGVVWYNPGGFEPDMHCKECGDDLG